MGSRRRKQQRAARAYMATVGNRRYEGWEDRMSEGYGEDWGEFGHAAWRRDRDDTLPVVVGGFRQHADPKPEPLPPELLALAMQAVSETRIGVPEKLEDLTKLQTYVVAENGNFLLRRGPIGVTCVASAVPGATGKLKPGLGMLIPKIPGELVQQTVSFFRAVCEKHTGSLEAFVQVWFQHPEGDTPGRWWIEVPEQRVSGGGVEHDGHSRPTETLIHVADIHSHGKGMSAFWSATDNGDEMGRGQKLFGVIGKVGDLVPDFKWRVGLGDGKFLDLNMADVVEIPEVTIRVNPSDDIKIVQAQIHLHAQELWKSGPFPEAWLAQVKSHYTTYTRQPSHASTDRRSLPHASWRNWAPGSENYQGGALFFDSIVKCWRDHTGVIREYPPNDPRGVLAGGVAPQAEAEKEVVGAIHASPDTAYLVTRRGILEV